MIYLSSFKLSECEKKNPNIYPYNVFRGKYIEPFVFTPITVFYRYSLVHIYLCKKYSMRSRKTIVDEITLKLTEYN